MTIEKENRNQLWQRLVDQVEREYQQLSASEKSWIADRLRQLEALQGQLDRLIAKGLGEQVCADCLGGCCAKGHNHMTLANLLSFLQRGERPPMADFSRTCPFLTETGCLLPAARRPYNCISFVCDIIEENLMPAEIEQFYAVERQLRGLYQQFAERYAGAGLTGMLIRAQRLGNRGYFCRPLSAG